MMTISRPFHDAEQFAFLRAIEAAYAEIREEARGVITGFKAVTWVRRSTFQRHQGFCQGYRGRFFLAYGGLDFGLNQRLCPRAAKLVEQVPGRVSAAFYLLDGKSHIKPHRGEFDCTLRAHMGLVVPEECSLRVAGETRPWREGAFLVFDDSYEHEAWNRSSETRCVLHLEFFKEDVPQTKREALLRHVRETIVQTAGRFGPALVAAELRGDPELLARLEQVEEGSAQARHLVQRFGLFFD